MGSTEELVNSFEKLRDLLSEEPFLNYYEERRKDAVAELDDMADEIFDFEGHAGGRKLNVSDLEQLREVEGEARENRKVLSQYLDKIYDIQESWESREQTREGTITDLQAFYSHIVPRGDQE